MSPPPMDRRVLLVSSVADLAGGAELSLFELATRLPAYGWTPELAVWSGGSLEVAFAGAGFRTYVLHAAACDIASPLGGATRRLPWLTPAVRPFNWLRLAVRPVAGETAWLADAVRASRCDIIHTNCDLALPATARAARAAGVAHVAHVRDRSRNWLHPRMARALRSADRVVAPGQGIADWFRARGIPAQPIQDPISTERLVRSLSPDERARWRGRLGVPPDAFALAVCGRLDERKGIEDLLAAAAVLDADGLDFVLLLAGKGREAYERRLRRLAASLRLEARLRWLGWRDDVADWLPATDGLAMLGRGEALPRTVVEGMLAGVAVVATSDGGAVELIEDERTGRLVRPGDVDGLSRALRQLIQTPQRARELGTAARTAAAARFDAERNAARIAALYDRIMRRGEQRDALREETA